MQNIAEFRIIGRVGRIDARERVTFIDVAANYRRKVGDEWTEDTHWNRISLFGKLHEIAGKYAKGDLIHATGRVKQNSYERNGDRVYTTDLIVGKIAAIVKVDADPSSDAGDESYEGEDVPF